MECPYCGQDNLQGADLCEACQQPLTHLRSGGAPKKNSIERSLEVEPLARLKPATPVTVTPSTPVGHALALLAEKHIGAVMVVEGDALVGIFTERDALMRISTGLTDAIAAEPVRNYMTSDPVSLTAEDTIVFALNRMAVGGCRHIPIKEEKKLVGVSSVRDFLGYLTEQFPEILDEDA